MARVGEEEDEHQHVGDDEDTPPPPARRRIFIAGLIGAGVALIGVATDWLL